MHERSGSTSLDHKAMRQADHAVPAVQLLVQAAYQRPSMPNRSKVAGHGHQKIVMPFGTTISFMASVT